MGRTSPVSVETSRPGRSFLLPQSRITRPGSAWRRRSRIQVLAFYGGIQYWSRKRGGERGDEPQTREAR